MKDLKVEVFTEFHLSEPLSGRVFIPLYNHKGQSYFAQHKCYLTHTHQHLRKTRFLRVPERLPEDAWINITPPLHPQATYLSLFILSRATNKWERERQVRARPLMQWGKGRRDRCLPPEEQPSLWVSGDWVSGQREGGRNPARQIHRKHV